MLAQKRKSFCENVGGEKIATMSGAEVSGPTANKIPRANGFDPVVRRKGGHNKRFAKQVPMERVCIDFVEIGVDAETGRKVESLIVINDHSRF